MIHLSEPIIGSLIEARKRKGLSQRALSAKSGVPQSHISKIENGGVDLRVSSLISLARVLGLELELVPKKGIPAVRSIARSLETMDVEKIRKQTQVALSKFDRLSAKIGCASPKLNLRDIDERQLRIMIAAASHLADMQPANPKILDAIENANKELERSLQKHLNYTEAFRKTDKFLKKAQKIALQTQEVSQPAYRLEEDTDE